MVAVRGAGRHGNGGPIHVVFDSVEKTLVGCVKQSVRVTVDVIVDAEPHLVVVAQSARVTVEVMVDVVPQFVVFAHLRSSGGGKELSSSV